jgi:hypothetical protein
METVAKFLSTLFNSRDQAHIFHLQTSSYAAHKALNEYYDAIVDLVDSYAENFQGRYGIIRGYTPQRQYFEGEEVVKYFTGLSTYIDSVRKGLPQDSDLNNIVDEISSLINSTIYKLKKFWMRNINQKVN